METTLKNMIKVNRILSAGSSCLPSGFFNIHIRPYNNYKALLSRNNIHPLLSMKKSFSISNSLCMPLVKTAQIEEEKMFCFQCEQTRLRKGCTTIGVCGKTPEVSHLQDLLIGILKGLSVYCTEAKKMGLEIPSEIYDFTFSAFFSTLTNVNFDPKRFPDFIKHAYELREQMKKAYEWECAANAIYVQTWKELETTWRPLDAMKFNWSADFLALEGKKFGINRDLETYGADIHGIREMIVYGLKGMSTYARHARLLGEWDDTIGEFAHQALHFLICGNQEERHDLQQNLNLALRVGEYNLKGMAILDQGHRKKFGVPSPSQVSTSPVPGKAILVTGHDLHDLEILLKASEGMNINIYTHGEMLPAHGYPGLRKYKHLAGHYGGPWQHQKYEFPHFPGPIVATTNCIVEPLKSYAQRMFTLNETGWPGVKHVNLKNDLEVELIMQSALACNGYTEKDIVANPILLTVGYGHEAILENADKILKYAESGDLKKIFVIGGCDGSENKRSYYTTMAANTPNESLILTMGCAKYRFNRKEFGELGDSKIPRLLDMGQCNDSYGAIVVVRRLATAMKMDINSLPISIALSWFEQKAIAVFLTLLHLGITNIRLGPVLPAFLTPNIVRILRDNYKLQTIDTKNPLEDGLVTSSKKKEITA